MGDLTSPDSNPPRSRLTNETASRTMRSYYVADTELSSLTQFEGFAIVTFSAGSFMVSAALTFFVEWQVNDWDVGVILMGICLAMATFLYALGVIAWKCRKTVATKIRNESDAKP